MVIRRSLACTLLLGSLLPVAAAQQQPPPPAKELPAGQQPVSQQPGQQDPEKATPKPVEESPQQRIDKLQAEQQRLEQEIQFVRERGKGAMARMVQGKLQGRKLQLESIDAGASKAAAPVAGAPPQPIRRARVMSDAEKQKMAPDVLFLVGGQPIRQEAVDQLVEYQRSFATSGDDNLRQSRAVMELLRSAATQAAFGDLVPEVEKRMQALRQELVNGAAFDALAQKNSQGPNADKGGDVSPVTRNSWLGLQVERMAFTTKEGLTPVFRTPDGFAVLLVKKQDKGAAPEQDTVSAQLLTIKYTADSAQLNMAAAKVMTGQVDVVVRDDKAMQMLPMMFRPEAAVPQPGETDADKGKDKPPAKNEATAGDVDKDKGKQPPKNDGSDDKARKPAGAVEAPPPPKKQ